MKTTDEGKSSAVGMTLLAPTEPTPAPITETHNHQLQGAVVHAVAAVIAFGKNSLLAALL